MLDERQTELVRPEWKHEDFHFYRWHQYDVTAVMCERDTLDITKITLESLLRFYPDLPILIIDGGSTDGSFEYVKLLELKYRSIRVWHRVGRNGHGTMLDEGIRKFITTKYFLLLDSDLMVHRGGWLEDMLMEIGQKNLYAIGTLMLVGESKEACGPPNDEADTLKYIHPSCGLFRTNVYLSLSPFIEHGAPLVNNMVDAKRKGLKVGYYPIEKYVSHLSGASWCDPRPIWRDDMDSISRPFFTFIARESITIDFLKVQSMRDFEIVIPYNIKHREKIFIHNLGYKEINNDVYLLRHKVHGEYIVEDNKEYDKTIDIEEIKRTLIAVDLPDEYIKGELKFIRRTLWQKRDCLY